MRVPAGVIAGLFAASYSLFGLLRHWHFGSSAYDLGIFDQVVWHLSRFEAPSSSIRGVSNIFGDHFHPVIALWTPLYWLFPAAETLIVAQAILLAVSIIPVYLFARDRLNDRAALGIAIAYGLFWGMQRTMEFDVHELAFAPLVIASAVLAMDRGRWHLFWIAAAALVLVKEDQIALLGGFALYLWFRGERRRAAWLAVASVVLFAVVIGFIVPALNDAGVYEYTDGAGALLRAPWRIPAMLVTPAAKLRTLFMWFAPFLFLPLASPLTLVALPLLLERLLSPSAFHWGTIFHYSAPLAPLLAMAAADGLARLDLTPKRAGYAAAVVVLLCSILPGGLPLWRLLSPAQYRAPLVTLTAPAVLSLIPGDAVVVAQAAIVPHLSERPRIYMLDDHAPAADYVVMHDALSPWPMPGVEALRRLVQERETRGYAVVAARDGWTLLRRQPNGGSGASR